MKNNLFVDKEWEFLLIDNICKTIRQKFTTKNVGILQLSYEYSGLMAQLVAHKLSTKNEPLDIEPINIPYTNEFDVVIHPNHLDPYENLIVLDSGCLSGNNFKKVEKILLDYGFSRNNLFFTCVASDLNSIFVPDYCPLWFNGTKDMIHFWWETKTNKFERNKMQNYTPGQGYKDGYRDREEGKANMAAVGRVTENHVYWDEYNLGWSEADRRIIDEARNNTSTGKKFLVD